MEDWQITLVVFACLPIFWFVVKFMRGDLDLLSDLRIFYDGVISPFRTFYHWLVGCCGGGASRSKYSTQRTAQTPDTSRLLP